MGGKGLRASAMSSGFKPLWSSRRKKFAEGKTLQQSLPRLYVPLKTRSRREKARTPFEEVQG